MSAYFSRDSQKTAYHPKMANWSFQDQSSILSDGLDTYPLNTSSLFNHSSLEVRKDKYEDRNNVVHSDTKHSLPSNHEETKSITPNTPQENNYPLTTSGSSTQSTVTPASPSAVNVVNGTLRADTFTYQSGFQVVFGNGNIDFGSGQRDVLDLSNIVSSAVELNLASTKTGGVIYNPGNGNQVFDSIKLKNNTGEVLFEGIETIKFADTAINLSVTPNDPLFSQQWNLHAMGVQNAWRFTTGSKNVLIGIEDTGLAVNSSGQIHSDLRSTIFSGNNYKDDLSLSPNITHGTSVQGVIAAASNNGVGITGINWNADVYHIDVMGGDAGDDDLAGATQKMIDRANSQGQRLVINLSLTGGYSTAWEQLIAKNQDTVLFVIAVGNTDKNSLESPADLASKYKNAIAVGASWGTKDYYGNPKTPGERISYDKWWGSNYGVGLTVMAPSEFPSTDATSAPDSYNNRFNGTSASAPNVSGVASLVWSINQGLSATQIKDIVSQTAYDLGAPGYDTVYGYGFVNADAAVRRAMALDRGVA